MHSSYYTVRMYSITSTSFKYTLLVLAIITVQVGALFFIGHPWICTCGYVEFWHGEVMSSGNSQHLTDWYTFSHIIHGFIFYLFLWALFPKIPLGRRLSIAVGIEAGWEILENSDFIMNRYRETALALDYYGDSIINSVSDTLSMMAGFILARNLPVWSIVALGIAFEIYTGYIIHDNLLLNVVQLIHPFEFISVWQAAV